MASIPRLKKHKVALAIAVIVALGICLYLPVVQVPTSRYSFLAGCSPWERCTIAEGGEPPWPTNVTEVRNETDSVFLRLFGCGIGILSWNVHANNTYSLGAQTNGTWVSWVCDHVRVALYHG